MKTQIKQIVLCILAACFIQLLGGCGEIGTGCINLLKENEILETKKAKLTDENGKLKSYPGARFKINIKGVDFPFRWCPAGSFKKEPAKNEKYNSAENDNNNLQTENQQNNTVEIQDGFWILETEVTRGMFERYLESPKSKTADSKTANSKTADSKTDHLLPKTEVSYEDASNFGEWLKGEICSKIQTQIKDKNLGYKVDVKLPTQNQWEYACRAGTTTAYFWGNELKDASHANCDFKKGINVIPSRETTEPSQETTEPSQETTEPSQETTEPSQETTETSQETTETSPTGPVDVRSYRPNDWGIYDMHGNVEEMCLEPAKDKSSPLDMHGNVEEMYLEVDNSTIVIRGGSYESSPSECQSSSWKKDNENSLKTRGFRVVLTISFMENKK